MAHTRPPERRPASVVPVTRGAAEDYDEDEAVGLPQIMGWLERHQVTLLALALIAAALIWKSAFLHAFYFRQDDFHFTELARQYGLSWTYLGYVGSGHLHPGVLALVWLLARVAPYNWAVASWMTLALTAIAGLACLRMLRTLIGNRLALLIPLALFLATPLTMPDDSWWTSAIESVPLQAAIFLAVTSQVHYVRTGRFRHALAAAGWVIAGLVFFEKAVVIPVVLLAVTAGFLVEGRILASLGRTLGRYWRAWALYGVLGAAYLVLLLTRLQQSTVQPKPTSVASTLTFSWSLVRESLVPGLLGGPWRWAQFPDAAVAYTQPGPSLVWLSLFATAAIVIATVVVRPRAWRAWAILVAWVAAADIVPLLLGRLATTGFAELLGLDTRYVADAAAVAALAVALAFWPVVSAPARGAAAAAAPAPARDSFAGVRWRVAGVVLTAVVVIGSLVSVSRYQQVTRSYNYAGNLFLDHVRTALAYQPPGTVIFDRVMPAIVQDGIFYGKYADQSRALAGMESPATRRDVRWTTSFDGTTTNTTHALEMVDSGGSLRYASVGLGPGGGVQVKAPAATGCFGYSGGVATMRFGQEPASWTGIIRVGYLAAASAAGEVVTIRYGSTTWHYTLRKGLNGAFFSVKGGAPAVTVAVPQPKGLCVGDVEAGRLAAVEPAGATS